MLKIHIHSCPNRQTDGHTHIQTDRQIKAISINRDLLATGLLANYCASMSQANCIAICHRGSTSVAKSHMLFLKSYLKSLKSEINGNSKIM